MGIFDRIVYFGVENPFPVTKNFGKQAIIVQIYIKDITITTDNTVIWSGLSSSYFQYK